MDQDDPITLQTATDVTDAVLVAAMECAEGAYGLGNDFRIDWERAYEMLESQYGWFVAEMDSPADRKIRRYVRANFGQDEAGGE